MAKIFGQLEKAQLENTVSDTASLPKGTATYRTDLNVAKVSNGTVMKELLDTNSAQTVSTKTLDSTNAYQSPVVTGALQLQEIATPATPSSGNGKVYFKADGFLYQLNDDGTESKVGAGGGGGLNYIAANPDAESNTTGWVPYADAAAARPVDGVGGAANITWTRSVATPLRNTASFLLTKTAANRQGEGVAYDFTIDSADKGKVLQISFDYAIASGTYSGGTPTTDSDLIAYIYRVTATGRLIEPTPIKLDGGVIGVNYKYQGTFQTDSDATGYRLIVHVATTSALAYAVQFDNFSVGPQVTTQGSVVTDWRDFSYTVGGTTTAPTEGAGATKSARWRRVGDSMEVVWFYSHSASGGGGLGAYLYPLPAGYAADSSKITLTTANIGTTGNIIGDSYITTTDGNATNFAVSGHAVLHNASNVKLVVPNAATAGQLNVFSDAFFSFANANIRVAIKASFPIAGWGGTVTMSSETTTRVVAAVYSTASADNMTNAAFTRVNYATKVQDTHNAVTVGAGVWNFRVPVSGVYNVNASATVTAVAAGTSIMSIRKNGVEVLRGPEANNATGAGFGGSSNGLIECVAGDTISAFFYEASGADRLLNGNSSANLISISRLAGPSQIAANETIAARYTGTVTSLIHATDTTLVQPNKVYDTHSAYNPTTGIFTAPVSGKYQVQNGLTVHFGSGTANSLNTKFYKGSALYGAVASVKNASTGDWIVGGFASDIIDLLAGETVKIVIVQTNGTSSNRPPFANADIINYTTITRIGN